jgi:hypothetical protein
MAEGRRGLTAEERLDALRRDRARLRRERMAREVAGPIWRRMVAVVPLLFRYEGTLLARVLRADRAVVIEALRDDAVFAVDTAMRLAHGSGFLAGGDVQAYLVSVEPIERLARRGLVDAAPCVDTVLVRPWAGPPRLLASVATDLPVSREAPGGYRVVDEERLRRELVGAVGARADLFALLERLEAASSAQPGRALAGG